MIAEFNVLDWLFAAGQGLFVASFFYFLYLVMRFSWITPIISDSFRRQSGALERWPDNANNGYFSVE